MKKELKQGEAYERYKRAVNDLATKLLNLVLLLMFFLIVATLATKFYGYR